VQLAHARAADATQARRSGTRHRSKERDMDQQPTVAPPNLLEVVFNRCFGWLVGLGLAPANFYLLEVPGRKSGRIFSTPVDLLRLDGQSYLVSPRGQTQWVRNARVSGVVALRQGRRVERYALREIAAEAAR
jgi:hypothetical protein